MANIDHFYQQGWDHIVYGLPCQDYARSWSNAAGTVFVGAVADGCSGSQGDPSVGAMLLANQAIQLGKGAVESGIDLKDVDFHASLVAWAKHGMGDVVNTEDWLATLVFFVKSPTTLKAYMFGDGAVCVRYRDGQVLTRYVEYPFNAPLYLAYQTWEEVMESFRSKDEFGATHRAILLEADGKEVFREVTRVDARELIFDFTDDMLSDKIQSITVFTDGIQQMKDQETAALRSVEEAARIFTDFKSSQGSFTRRLCTKRFSPARRKDSPQDDFAQATLIL